MKIALGHWSLLEIFNFTWQGLIIVDHLFEFAASRSSTRNDSAWNFRSLTLPAYDLVESCWSDLGSSLSYQNGIFGDNQLKR
jgi:hypothetical protein